MDATVGDSLSLTVTITDFNLPVDTIVWMFNGDVVNNNTALFTVFINGGLDEPPPTTTLQLSTVSNLTNEGMYTVDVTNRAGNSVSVFDVTVLGKE